MKCRSRSTLGIVIGWIGIILSILIIIGAIAFLAYKDNIIRELRNSHDANRLRNEYEETKQIRWLIVEHGTTIAIGIIVLCMVSILISVLLIQGIKKKRHSYMIPYLVLSTLSFVVNCLKTLLLLIAGQIFNFIFNALFLGLNAIILYKIYTLYRDIQAKNNERNGQIISASGVGYTVANSGQPNAYAYVPQKA